MSVVEGTAAEAAAPGRSCPLHYRYHPEVFAAPAPAAVSRLDVVYVVGGLYGNDLALGRVLELFDREPGRKRLVFNGDFHWFDADPALFERVQRGVLGHVALRGNVETELAVNVFHAEDHATGEVGCGCAYPDWIEDDVVERSNRIIGRLRRAVTREQRRALADLPMWLRADLGDFKLAIVHGDAQSLAGWGFSQEHLRDAAHRAEVRRWFERAQVDAFACTHTCLPVFQRIRPSDGRADDRWIFNNGATGMPNFTGDGAGLLTRFAVTAFTGPERRFGVRVGDVRVDAIAVDIGAAAWRERFLRQWPEGSDAHTGYFHRIARGPSYRQDEAIRIDE